MTTAALDWPQRAQSLVDDLAAKGAVRSVQVAAAMATVPRHAFITGHYAGPGHTQVDPEAPDPDLLGLAYADRGIMTHIPGDAACGYSSASQPSVVARMLEAAGLAPGTRVLEIGAGTGYNSALIAHLTGTQVVTVEFSPVVAGEARAAHQRIGEPRVTVVTGDGYDGHAEGGPYDRIVVTCGVAGASPAWLEQLAPGGQVLAPMAHAGMHPLTRITRTPAGVRARLLEPADFMNASGPLYAGACTSPSTRGNALPVPDVHRYGAVPDGLEMRSSYADLWMFLGCRDPCTTCAGAEGTDEYTGCALLDGGAVVYVRPGALHLAGDAVAAKRLGDSTAVLVAAWEEAGRPGMDRWACDMVLAGQAEAPIRVPRTWELT